MIYIIYLNLGGKYMKRFICSILIIINFLSVSLSSVIADTRHVKEDLYAISDYVVISPEYNNSKGCWEVWALAYKTGTHNYSGSANIEKDKCVSASIIPVGDPMSSLIILSTLLSDSYYMEDLMEISGQRYYEFAGFSKKCYMSAPGSELTTIMPINTIEIYDKKNKQIIQFISDTSNPSFALLCQLWLYSSNYDQIPSSVTKTYGFDTIKRQTPYSNNVRDYCSNQNKLQKYCDSLIPSTSSISHLTSDNTHVQTEIQYNRGPIKLYIYPGNTNIIIYLESNS